MKISPNTKFKIVVMEILKPILYSILGGNQLVFDIENHFNKEIASTLLRFFMDSKLNKNCGIIIFSTHYPKLLDEYDRNDSIFITRNRAGITAENLCNILKRNDIKISVKLI